jgi:predicted GNAT family acetyltransferase
VDNVESSEIIDNVSAHRFEVHAGGSMARLDYRLQNRTIVLVHTEVPPELENCGIGAKLVKAALEYARQSSLMVVPRCSFAAAYIRRHPQYQAQVEPSGGMR